MSTHIIIASPQQNITAKVAYERPSDPLQFMLNEMEQLRAAADAKAKQQVTDHEEEEQR